MFIYSIEVGDYFIVRNVLFFYVKIVVLVFDEYVGFFERIIIE